MPQRNKAQKLAKTATSTKGAIKERKAALAQMNEALRKIFDDLEDSLATQKAETVKFYYDLGTKVHDVQEKSKTKYAGNDGSDGFKLLQRAMNMHKRTLQAAGQFVRTIGKDEMVELCGLYDPETNFSLHWGHMAYLLTVSERPQRLRFAKDAIRRLMEPKELYEMIKEGRGGPKHGGPPHKIPPTVEKQVDQFAKLSQQWVDKDGSTWHGPENNIVTNVMNMPDTDYTESLLLRLQQVGECCETMSSRTDELRRQYAGLEQYVQEKLTEQAEADAAEARSRSVERRSGESRRRHLEV